MAEFNAHDSSSSLDDDYARFLAELNSKTPAIAYHPDTLDPLWQKPIVAVMPALAAEPYEDNVAGVAPTITALPDITSRNDDGEGIFSDLPGSDFSEATDIEVQPGTTSRTAALAIFATAAATVAIIFGATGTLSPDKPAAQTELHVTPPVDAPGIELEQPDTDTPAPSPTDLPRGLLIIPAPPASEKTAATTKPTEHASTPPTATTPATPSAPRRTPAAEAPIVPVVPHDTTEPTIPDTSPTPSEAQPPAVTETDTPAPAPEAPEPSADAIAALKREVSGSARAQAGGYASSHSLDQILAATGFGWQAVLDWQQRYRSGGQDTTATLESTLGTSNDSAIRDLTNYTDRMQQTAVNSDNGDFFELAWADHRTAAQLRSRQQSGEALSFPDAIAADLAKVTTRSFNGHEVTLAAVVAEYPDQFGGSERRLQWYVVVAGAENTSKFVRLAEKIDQPPAAEPTPEPTSSGEPTPEPTPTDEPATETSPREETSPANKHADREDRSDRANDRRDRPSWLRGDRGNNRSFR
jgi:hypothetical protein